MMKHSRTCPGSFGEHHPRPRRRAGPSSPIPPASRMATPLTATAARLHFAVTTMKRGIAMPILTIRNVPSDLYNRLKASATERHRSLNSEVIECLQVALAARRPREVEGFLERARATRDALAAEGVSVTSAVLAQAREDGRA